MTRRMILNGLAVLFISLGLIGIISVLFAFSDSDYSIDQSAMAALCRVTGRACEVEIPVRVEVLASRDVPLSGRRIAVLTGQEDYMAEYFGQIRAAIADRLRSMGATVVPARDEADLVLLVSWDRGGGVSTVNRQLGRARSFIALGIAAHRRDGGGWLFNQHYEGFGAFGRVRNVFPFAVDRFFADIGNRNGPSVEYVEIRRHLLTIEQF